MNKFLKRLKNKKVLLSIASGVLLILVNMGYITPEASDQFLTNANVLLGLGVSVGILSNPDKDKPLRLPKVKKQR
ncbi:hypothetical protein [Halobacillus karajensis]|uniref:hypothetical protein n=1 Tax=Halobacillus karajensis TaxID=195088 RepID=UPI00045CA416|nr:hypothetical protein [Halobacillus karajensis]CDQ21715.1 hypothetical protein BN982_04124 [Halobacillus karajensis]